MPDGSYFLTRYDDLNTVYRDVATWSSDKKLAFKPKYGDSLLYEHHTTSLVFNDPPYHTRVRRLLGPSFTPRALKVLQPRIEALVDRLLERAAERREIDLIEDFAAAIPMQLIGDMLGVPREERGPLRGWSLAILGALEPMLTPQQFEEGATSVADFKKYLQELIARRMKEGSGDEGEILSQLVAGSEFAGDERVIARGHDGLYAGARVADVGGAKPAAADAPTQKTMSGMPEKPASPEAPKDKAEPGMPGMRH